MKRLSLSFCVVVVFFPMVPLHGQEIPDAIEPLGNLMSTDTFGLAERIPLMKDAQDGTVPSPLLFLAPAVTDTDSSLVSSLSGGIVFNSNRKKRIKTATQVDVRFASISVDDGSADFDQYRVRIKETITPSDKKYKFAVAVQFTDTRHVRDDISLIAATSYSAKDGKVTFTGNLSWNDRRPDGGNDIDDLGGGVGISVKRKSVLVSVDYAFDNDVVGDDMMSLSVQTTVGDRSKIGFGMATGSVVFGNYSVVF